jgi:hypothetical protein
MVWWKKIVLFGLSLIALIFILNIGLSFWIKKELPKIINEKNESPYHIVYKTIDITLLSGTILINDITIVPKKAMNKTSDKTGLFATISDVDIKGISIWSILFSKKIKASKITINKPEIILYKKDEKALNNPKSINESVVKPFKNTISVSDIELENANLKIISTKTNLPSLVVSNLSLELDNVVLHDETIKEKIPFNYNDFYFSCDSIYFRANEFYHLKAENIQSTKTDIKIENFKLIPEYGRAEFVRKIPVEKDIYSTTIQTISLKDMDWGFEKEDFYFHSKNIVLDSVYANIYRSKIPTDDLSKKPLYNKLLREIPFKLQVDELAIRSSILEYEEEKTFEKGAGLLRFNQFNMAVTNINSGFKAEKLDDVKIKIDCQFMNVSPLKVDWRFNVLDKSDGFTIKGTILNFPAKQLKPFTKPYMNVDVEGMLDEVYFNFAGNDLKSKGNFAIKYEDLNVTVYKKNSRKEKNKFLSAIGNLFVKKDSDEKVKEVEVEVERIPEKSFYNFLWRNIGEGLKKTLL